MSRREVVLASSNRGKLKELTTLLGAFDWSLITQDSLGIEPAPEPFGTFVENALAKARHASTASGRPALADDSGLCVHALGGAPGVRSARYAGSGASDADNITRLLQELADAHDRRAWFHCTLVYLEHADDPAPLIASGAWIGEILTAARGSGGFGYDPVFFLPEQGLSAAELEPATKAECSHRGVAMRAFAAAVEARRLSDG
ncbi:MAG: RdgB/HAM1 family non-canonical purine NTP pyrophosphatase [Pseudomonadota bacterium]